MTFQGQNCEYMLQELFYGQTHKGTQGYEAKLAWLGKKTYNIGSSAYTFSLQSESENDLTSQMTSENPMCPS